MRPREARPGFCTLRLLLFAKKARALESATSSSESRRPGHELDIRALRAEVDAVRDYLEALREFPGNLNLLNAKATAQNKLKDFKGALATATLSPASPPTTSSTALPTEANGTAWGAGACYQGSRRIGGWSTVDARRIEGFVGKSVGRGFADKGIRNARHRGAVDRGGRRCTEK